MLIKYRVHPQSLLVLSGIYLTLEELLILLRQAIPDGVSHYFRDIDVSLKTLCFHLLQVRNLRMHIHD